ncbi:MAG: TOBE domain-containing protein, partial [Devosia nanyangense]|nr:TOBE domain-containing protein [Devosia nanyangense]
VGTPMEIYSRPASRFVANFVGSPSMNFLPVSRVTDRDGKALVTLPDQSEIQTQIPTNSLPSGDGLTLGIRAEAVRVAADGSTRGKSDVIERLGERTLAYVRLSDNSTIVAEDTGNSRLVVGESVSLRLDGASAHLFDAQDKAYHAAS